MVIGLAAASDQYGVTDEKNTSVVSRMLQFMTVRCFYNYFPIFSCWLSTDGRPVIWAFAAPMIAIVLVGTASTIVQ